MRQPREAAAQASISKVTVRPLLPAIRCVFLGLMALSLSGAAPLEKVTLQLKWHHQFQFAGYYAAQEKGFYREAGLEVNLLEGKPGIDVVKEVVQGHVQFGVGTSALLLSRHQGLPVVVLATVFQHSPIVLVARSGANIGSVQDLPGKRLMIEKQSDELIAYLRKEGVSEKSVTLLEHTFNPNDLIQGKVDCMSAYLTDEPYFLDKVRFPYLTFTPRMGGIDFYGDNLFTSESELKAHPDRVKAFREASMKGWKYAMQNPEEISNLILNRYGQGRGRAYLLYEAQKMNTLLQPTLVEMGYMYRGRWQHIVDTYAELGLLPKGFDLEGFIYEPEAGARQINRRLLAASAILLGIGVVLATATLFISRLYLRLRREIASREEAEQAMRQEQEGKALLELQLQQARKMESLGNLAGGIAHDMNNVLGAILGIASAQGETQPDGTSTHRAFETIARAAERGGKMVKSLLHFARQSPAEQRELDVNVILREEVELLERTTLSKIRLEMDLEPRLRPMLGDPSALSQAIMNLCVNAVDAMPEGGTLTLRTRNLDQDGIGIIVEDTGTGMPESVLEKAMDPFFTTKDVGKGTGLGLSMVYSIVKAHFGHMELHSELGQGTRVSMRFPACQSRTQAGQPASQAASGTAKRALQVLLVDDDELILSSIGAVLHSLGHSVVSANRGEEALAKLEAGYRPEVIILDLNMPGLGGSGTLPRLRALLPQVPVFLSTGRADQTAQDLTKAYPFLTLLPKPYHINDLRTILDAIHTGPS